MTRQEEFVELNRALDPTPAASDFNTRLVAAGHKHNNLGQGSEKTPLSREGKKLIYGNLLQRLLPPSFKEIFRAVFSRKKMEDEAYAAVDAEMNYNANGDPKLDAAISGWSKRIFGFGGHAKTTEALQHLGRSLMGDVANKWGAIYRDRPEQPKLKPVALVPANSWALTKTALEEAGFEVVEYPVNPEDMAGSFEAKLLELQEQGREIGIAYFNFPHNATGLHLTREENIKIKAIADKYNENRTLKMMLLYDMPYFAACKKNNNRLHDTQGYLDTGMEGVFDEKDFDPSNPDPVGSPIAVCCSGSKFFRTTKRGLAWGHFSKDIIKAVRGKLNLSGNGVRRDPEFNEAACKALAEKNDPIWQAQLDADRQKFEDNYKFLCETFGEAVVKGGPNLVALIKLPNVFNKAVICHDGQVRNIGGPGKEGRQDAIEIMANGTPDEAGVLLVDGDETMEGESLFRIALAMPTEDFKNAVGRLKRIYDYIDASPDTPSL